MRAAAYVGMTFAVAGLALAAAWAVLPACSLVGAPWAGHCPPVTEAPDTDRLDELAARRAALEAEIASLQRRVAALPICAVPIPEPEPEPEPVVAVPPPPPPPAPPPAPPQPPRDIAQDRWEEQDISLLEGCWDLDSNFETVEPGNVRYPVRSWSMCFDANGRGRQEFRAFRTQVHCSGGVRGAFQRSGNLDISFTEDARCATGGQVARRQATCTLRADGRAACTSIRHVDQLQQSFVLRRRR